MNVAVSKECSRSCLERRLHVVRDADGSWHVMDGVSPVLASDAGQWLHDGAGSETAVTDAPHWLVETLSTLAPADWRMCRFELVGVELTRPDAVSRDDAVLLDTLGMALKTEREARARAEAELEKLRKGIEDGKERDGRGEGAGADREGQDHDGAGGARGKRQAVR